MVGQTHRYTLTCFFAICQIGNGSFFFLSSLVRMLLQPKGSRSHVRISSITKRSFLTSSNSADTLAVSPSPELKYYPITMSTRTNIVIHIHKLYFLVFLTVNYHQTLHCLSFPLCISALTFPSLPYSPKSSSLSPSHSLLPLRQRHLKPDEESPSGTTKI